MNRESRLPVVVVALVAGLALTGCTDRLPFGNSADDGYRMVAQDLIEGELAERIGLGPLEATCEGRNLGPGDTFSCTALASEAGIIEFRATISESGDEVDLASTNLLAADQVTAVEAFAASLIEGQAGRPFSPENFECADRSLIVRAGDVIDCLATDPADGTVFHAPVTIDDLETLSVTVTIGDPIP
jgi:hypothetical protein